jgi:hypothetical protein
MTCHKFPDKICALRNAFNLYGCLVHHIQDKEYVKCPKDNTRHTAIFNFAVERTERLLLLQLNKTSVIRLARHQSTQP